MNREVPRRGVARPQGPACDIGAFELATPPNSLTETLDGLVEGGSLEGEGSGESVDNRLSAMRNKLSSIEDLVDQGDAQAACEELASALLETDGQPHPPDFFQGAGATELAAAIQRVQSDLGRQ